MKLLDLVSYCDDYLEVGSFKDYCPNGLQVEGSQSIRKLVTGVTASQALIEQAIEQEADAILVHHGFFWKGESPRVVGMKRSRLSALLEHDISLMAYHLPLDAHEVVGNNVQLAKVLDIDITGPLEPDASRSIGNVGKTRSEMSLDRFAEHVSTSLGRDCQVISGGNHGIQTIAWCTGAAQGFIEQAIELGADAYVSGEISEQTVHVAREMGIHYIAAGHHATERYGARALGQHLEEKFDLDVSFVDIDNPV